MATNRLLYVRVTSCLDLAISESPIRQITIPELATSVAFQKFCEQQLQEDEDDQPKGTEGEGEEDSRETRGKSAADELKEYIHEFGVNCRYVVCGNGCVCERKANTFIVVCILTYLLYRHLLLFQLPSSSSLSCTSTSASFSFFILNDYFSYQNFS